MNINDFFNFNDGFGKISKKKDDPKAKVRNRGDVCCDNTHPKVKDNKDHFPINSENQARNAVARVNQYYSVPSWWAGSLQDLVNTVTRAVKKKYKGIEISTEGKKAGHTKKAVFEMDDLILEDSAIEDIDKDDFNDKLEALTRLKINHPFIYEAATQELKDKVMSGQELKGWGPDKIKKLLSELGEQQ